MSALLCRLIWGQTLRAPCAPTIRANPQAAADLYGTATEDERLWAPARLGIEPFLERLGWWPSRSNAAVVRS